MTRPSLLHGILVALVLALASLPLVALLPVLFSAGLGIKIFVGIMGYSYIIYLFGLGRRRVGRVLLGGIGVAAGMLALVYLSPCAFIVFMVGLIWITRCVTTYSSIVSVLLDFFVCMLSLGCLLWAFRSYQTIAVAVWSFFLIQALVALIPVRFLSRGSNDITAKDNGNEFNRAYQAAEKSIREIIQGSV